MTSATYLCSFHIPKTGGTTFAGHARRVLRSEEFLIHGPFARADLFFNNQPQIEELSDSQKQGIRIVHGHGAGLALAKIMRGRDPEFMVILRDPYARFVSGFHHYNNERTSSGRDAVSEEVYSESRSKNFFARQLRRHFSELAPSNEPLSLECLMPILRSFKYILLTEYLDQQLPMICALYGLEAGVIEARRINKSKGNVTIDRATFDQENWIDGAIYSALTPAGRRSASSIENPFGYQPDALRSYLDATWSRYTRGAELATAYDELVEACKKTFKLQAAQLKLTSGAVSHVSDKQLLLDRVNAAMNDWVKTLNDKELSVAHFWSGSMFMKEANPAMAEDHLRESIRLNPKNDNALAHLAKLLHRRGKKTDAASYLLQALALNPERPSHQALRRVLGG